MAARGDQDVQGLLSRAALLRSRAAAKREDFEAQGAIHGALQRDLLDIKVRLGAVRARREGTGGSYRSRQREAADRRRPIEGEKHDCLRRLARCTQRGLRLERQYHRALAEADAAEAAVAAAVAATAERAETAATVAAAGAAALSAAVASEAASVAAAFAAAERAGHVLESVQLNGTVHFSPPSTTTPGPHADPGGGESSLRLGKYARQLPGPEVHFGSFLSCEDSSSADSG